MPRRNSTPEEQQAAREERREVRRLLRQHRRNELDQGLSEIARAKARAIRALKRVREAELTEIVGDNDPPEPDDAQGGQP